MDMALKIFSMANGLSNTGNSNMGSSFYQLTTYLRLITDLYDNAKSMYGEDQAMINAYVQERLALSAYSGFTITSFIQGGRASSIAPQAYNIYLLANDVKRAADNDTSGGTYATQDIKLKYKLSIQSFHPFEYYLHKYEHLSPYLLYNNQME